MNNRHPRHELFLNQGCLQFWLQAEECRPVDFSRCRLILLERAKNNFKGSAEQVVLLDFKRGTDCGSQADHIEDVPDLMRTDRGRLSNSIGQLVPWSQKGKLIHKRAIHLVMELKE